MYLWRAIDDQGELVLRTKVTVGNRQHHSPTYRTVRLLKYVGCAAVSLLLAGCAMDHHGSTVRSNVVPSYWLQDADTALLAGFPSWQDGVHERHLKCHDCRVKLHAETQPTHLAGALYWIKS